MCVHVKVCVWEDVRSVNSQEYQELQSLYEDSQLQLKQVSPLSRVSWFKKNAVAQLSASNKHI